MKKKDKRRDPRRKEKEKIDQRKRGSGDPPKEKEGGE
jgi:hypothetical protein